MTELPAPMTPAGCDLRGYEFMPFYGNHLFGSDFNSRSSDAEWRAALTLWWAAWNQVPAASLPDDDGALCRLADMGREIKAWRRLKEVALHGFVKCSDGRLYHKFLAPKACEAWDRRLKERERKAKWRLSKGQDKDVPETGTKTGTSAGHAMGHFRDVPAERRGEGEDSELKERKKEGETPLLTGPAVAPSAPSVSAKDKLWQEGPKVVAAMVGKTDAEARKLIGAWLKGTSPQQVLGAIARCQEERPIDPVPFIVAYLNRSRKAEAETGYAPLQVGGL